jgi:predicted amidophosphoribosyltransferase
MQGLRIPLVCALEYRGAIRSILYQYKDHRIRQLAGEIAPALAAAVNCAADHAHLTTKSVVLVPMPTRKSNIRRRGFDATAHLTSQVQRIIPTRGTAQLLIDKRTSRGAKHQGVFERETAIRDAFSLRNTCRSSTGLPVILVDDIVTTGSTVREAALTLILAGVQVAGIATAAGTP